MVNVDKFSPEQKMVKCDHVAYVIRNQDTDRHHLMGCITYHCSTYYVLSYKQHLTKTASKVVSQQPSRNLQAPPGVQMKTSYGLLR